MKKQQRTVHGFIKGCASLAAGLTGCAIHRRGRTMAHLSMVAAGMLLAVAPAQTLQWGAAPKVSAADHQTMAPTGRIIVKFTDDSGLAARDGRLALLGASQESQAEAARDRLVRLMANEAIDFDLQRHFSRDAAAIDADRAQAEARSGLRLPNLNRYVRLEPQTALTRAQLVSIVERLLEDPAVEAAFLEPVAVPAALGFDAFTGVSDLPLVPLAGNHPQPPTPNFEYQQGYLDPAPIGVDAEGVWALPGGKGQSVKVLDIEGAWKWDHEDLPEPFFTAGGTYNDTGWRNHGTAVVGEIRAVSNGFGVTGIAHEVEVGGVSIAELSVADAINTCAAALDEGDIFLIELHAPGPNATGSGQFGYVCMEFWQDNFDAILLATAGGRICVEAAGNGEQNFDDPVYQNLFNREFRDSGAIICGATHGSDLEPAWFTNYGQRVDLHGWGYSVVTTGYGDLQGGDETEWYTAGFSGTSSASPIVTGSVAVLQGLVKAAYGIPLNAKLARDILVATGTPQSGWKPIGPRPDLTAAWALAQTGIGQVAGQVTDAESGLPLEQVRIAVQETGAFTVTDAAGSYRLPLLADGYHLRFDSYFHETLIVPASVAGGVITELDVPLQPRELVAIRGYVFADDGATPLGGVRVTPIDTPVASTTTGGDGRWELNGFPAGRTYSFRFDHLPGYGADVDSIAIPADVRTEFSLIGQLSPAAEQFEGGDGGFLYDPIWERATPVAGGPSAGFSGDYCFGVGMEANYGDNVHGFLTSPVYDVSDREILFLSFHYWCETESGFDGANVQVWSSDTNSWETVHPFEAYPSVSLSGIGYEPGWSGSTAGWVGTVFDVSDYISEEFAFRIQFGSDGYVTGPGFWIDDVAFNFGDAVSSTPAEVAASSHLRLSASSPVRDGSQIRLVLPQGQDVQLALYDASGRRIRILQDGPLAGGEHLLRWDGRDQGGQAAGSGIYFLRLSSRDRSLDRSQRIVLSR